MLQEPQREESAALVAAVCLISKKCGSISEFFFFLQLFVLSLLRSSLLKLAFSLQLGHSFFLHGLSSVTVCCVAASLQERGRVLPSLSPDFGQR